MYCGFKDNSCLLGLLFVADYCYDSGTISLNNNNVVTACVNGYSTNVCYSDNYDVASSLATAACNSQGLEYDCEHYFSFTSMAVDNRCRLCLPVYNTFKYVVQEVITLTSFFFSQPMALTIPIAVGW